MNMVKPQLMGRMSSVLIRVLQYHLIFQRDEEGGFSPEFVATQCQGLNKILRAAERLGKSVSTTDFLLRHLNTVRFVGKFVLPQVLPVCYLLGLVNCNPMRAAEAPILDTTKEHYVKFLEVGVDPKFFDLTVLVVALQFGVTPFTIENTGCEGVRKQLNVHDFMLEGQLFYSLRPVPGCNYIHPEFVVYVKKWGPEGKWVPAVRNPGTGRWSHP